MLTLVDLRDELGDLVHELDQLSLTALVDPRPIGERPAWSGRYSAGLTRVTLAEYGDRCHLCGLTGASTADHLLPRSRFGSDDPANLRPAHLACNSARGARPLSEWFARRPRSYRTSTPPSREW